MNTHTLDFTGPVPSPRQNRPGRWPRYRMNREFRQLYGLLCGLVCGIALVGLLRQHTQTQSLREQYQTQTIQYDSLLSAKVEADRQLEQLRIRLINYRHP